MTPNGNQLSGETSPYLLQHASNPVHWRPWNATTLAEARALRRPILLSIGYAACHWCHVMAHESFEDPDTAAQVNANFVAIKVDREERPDIDSLFMAALHALGEQGGWPLTMFLTPDAVPFWGGTYFPPEPRWGRPSFRQVLQTVAEAHRSGRRVIATNAAAVAEALRRRAAARPGGALMPADLDAVRNALLRQSDPLQGGLLGAPKFPNAPIFRFLWQDSWRAGDLLARDATRLLLARMSLGGIYDHLGGGYARYATDAAWRVPHFEKMLYDNAQIIELLALVHADRPDPLFAVRIERTIGWLDRDMTTATRDINAAFAASEDADSEGEEGRFYVWSEPEIDALLGAGAGTFKTAYGVTEAGNWDGRTILHRVTPEPDPLTEPALMRHRATLFAARAHRVRPARDDKVLADWNGLAVAALCRAAGVLVRPDWLRRATDAFDFVLTNMTDEAGRLQHAWRLGRASATGVLDDHAAMARAALALFEASGETRRLDQAVDLVEAAQRWFGDRDGSFYTTASDADDVPLARPRGIADDATPSAIGLMAEVLARLHLLTGAADWRRRAEAAIAAFSGDRERLTGMPTLLAAADLLQRGACVVVAGPRLHPLASALVAVALAAPDPAVAVLRADATQPVPRDHPAAGKLAGTAGAAAYVCRGSVCELPVTDPAVLDALLRQGGMASAALDTGSA